MGRLQDRIVLITGAAGGIGLAMAELFASEGADVVICDLEEARAQDAAEAIRQAGGLASGYRADVTVLDDVRALMERVGADKGWVEGQAFVVEVDDVVCVGVLFQVDP